MHHAAQSARHMIDAALDLQHGKMTADYVEHHRGGELLHQHPFVDRRHHLGDHHHDNAKGLELELESTLTKMQ